MREQCRRQSVFENAPHGAQGAYHHRNGLYIQSCITPDTTDIDPGL